MSRRLTDQISTWVEEALDTYLLGDQAMYDLTILLDPQAGPALCLVIWMPSLVLGDQMQVVGIIPNPPSVRAEQVNQFVHDGLEAMRKQRSEQAAAPQPPQSLVVPGR